MNVYDPGTLKGLLGRHNISASKGLGQHFLVSKNVVERIVDCFAGCEGVLEIGPGPGVLTGPISSAVTRMIALEIDQRMPPVLAESAPSAEVREVDALKANLGDILEELPAPRGVVSNLPYYITGPLLTKIAEARAHFDIAALMMQKEVGERVLAAPKTSARGSLSVYLQAQFEIQKVTVAPAGAFLPPPKVDSVVLKFVPRPTGLDPTQERKLFKLIRAGFTQPRKTLVNNLMSMGIGRDEALEGVLGSGLGEKARPQELSLDEWIGLNAKLSP